MLVFPDPVGPTNATVSPWADVKGNVLQDRVARLVSEGDISKFDRAVDFLGIFRVVSIFHFDVDIGYLKYPLSGRHGTLHCAVLQCERPDRIEETLNVEKKSNHHTDV